MRGFVNFFDGYKEINILLYLRSVKPPLSRTTFGSLGREDRHPHDHPQGTSVPSDQRKIRERARTSLDKRKTKNSQYSQSLPTSHIQSLRKQTSVDFRSKSHGICFLKQQKCIVLPNVTNG